MTSQDISDFELFLNLKNLEILKELSCKEITENNAHLITSLLNRLLIYFPYGKDKYSYEKLFRLVVNKRIVTDNIRLTRIENLKYPPKKELVKKYGRCNLPEQQILYASLMSMTALGEMKPQAGDLITETVWKRKSLKPLTHIPVYSNQPISAPMINEETDEVIPFLTNIRTFEMNELFRKQISNHPKNLRQLCLEIVQFFADCFSKPVNSLNHYNYLFSSYIADRFLNKVDGGEVDAIYYPSVADKLNSENLAIKPAAFDEIYEPFGVIENLVLQDPSTCRGYHMKTIIASTNFNFVTGEIIWDEQKSAAASFQIQNFH